MAGDRCEFQYDYPYPHRDLDPGCQFTEETEFFRCGGKSYCRFHLPMADEDGNETAKAAWARGDREVESFNAAIDAIIETAAKSEQPANLSGVVFPGDIAFDERELPESLWYEARFEAAASYHKATFSGPARFDGATFSGPAWFGGATFSGPTWFDDATFSGPTWFVGATFSRDADFSWSGKLESRPKTEDGGEKEETTSLAEPGVFYRLDFSGSHIDGVANFNNRTFKEVADFSGRVFGRPPKFHGASLHQGTKWRGTDFTDTESDDAEQDYRTLRLAMEQIRDRPQEAVFFALEQRAMRHQAKWWQLRKWLSYGYDWTCDYGRSAGWPLAWLAGVAFLFLMAYGWFSEGYFDQPAEADELLTFIVRQIVKPFAVWGPLKTHGELWSNLSEGRAFLFRVLATLQSLLSLGLIALFILALRWQFRRG